MKRHLKGLVERGVGQATRRRSDPIERIMLSSAGFARRPTEAQVDELAADVHAAVKPLLQLAMSGSVHAIRRVTDIAASLGSETMLLACMHQDAANTVARERTTWPLNIPADPAERRRALRLVTGARRLPLGAAAAQAAAPRRRTVGLSNPATAAVLLAMKAIQIERGFRVPSELFPALQPDWSVAAATLPELDASPVVVEAWFGVIWSYVLQRHGGQPEHSPLRRLVEEASGSHASASAVRAAIRMTLRQAFQQLVAGRRQARASAALRKEPASATLRA